MAEASSDRRKLSSNGSTRFGVLGLTKETMMPPHLDAGKRHVLRKCLSRVNTMRASEQPSWKTSSSLIPLFPASFKSKTS